MKIEKPKIYYGKKLLLGAILLVVMILCVVIHLCFIDDIKQEEKSNLLKSVSEINTSYEQNEFVACKSEDKRIVIDWHNLPIQDGNIKVMENGNYIITEQIQPSGSYVFTNGTHGKFYTFVLMGTGFNGNKFFKAINRKYLDFSKLPKLMTLYINTADGLDPVFKMAKNTNKDSFGVSITDNKYKDAVLDDGTKLKIKVRGNSSAYGPKKSYKIVLEHKRDMLGFGKEYVAQEWLLLNKDALKTYFGFELGKFVGMEWEPRMRFVNVMLNGVWKGLFVLCEPIKRHPKRLAVDADGFIIESDGYWWKEKEGSFFASSLLNKQVRFTFKYPKDISGSDDNFIAIENYVNSIDEMLKNEPEKIADYIDLDTFTGWLLAHELMGTTDGFGSNMFFYKQNMSPTSKLKMGPLWDFDSMFVAKPGEHSAFWSTNSTYLPFLINNPVFIEYYKKKYYEIVPHVEQYMRSVMKNMQNIPGLTESMDLDKPEEGFQPLQPINADTYIDKLHERIEWLNQEIKKL